MFKLLKYKIVIEILNTNVREVFGKKITLSFK